MKIAGGGSALCKGKCVHWSPEKLVSSKMTKSDCARFFRVGRMKTETEKLPKDIRKQHWMGKMAGQMDCRSILRHTQRRNSVFIGKGFMLVTITREWYLRCLVKIISPHYYLSLLYTPKRCCRDAKLYVASREWLNKYLEWMFIVEY